MAAAAAQEAAGGDARGCARARCAAGHGHPQAAAGAGRSHLARLLSAQVRLDSAAVQANMPAWLRFPDHERVAWIDSLIHQLWPHAAAAAASMGESFRLLAFPVHLCSPQGWCCSARAARASSGSEPPCVDDGPLAADFHSGRRKLHALALLQCQAAPNSPVLAPRCRLRFRP